MEIEGIYTFYFYLFFYVEKLKIYTKRSNMVLIFVKQKK